MTHLFDTSAALAHYFDEPGADRVEGLLQSEGTSVGLSVISVFEIAQAVAHRTANELEGRETARLYASIVHEIVPVSPEVVQFALDLRAAARARVALGDILIAATAALHRAVLVHRDPHFSALPAGRPDQETLPEKT